MVQNFTDLEDETYTKFLNIIGTPGINIQNILIGYTFLLFQSMKTQYIIINYLMSEDFTNICNLINPNSWKQICRINIVSKNKFSEEKKGKGLKSKPVNSYH